MTLRQQAVMAAESIITDVVSESSYVGGRKCGLNAIDVIKKAAELAFIYDIQGEATEVLRKAMLVLRNEGELL